MPYRDLIAVSSRMLADELYAVRPLDAMLATLAIDAEALLLTVGSQAASLRTTLMSVVRVGRDETMDLTRSAGLADGIFVGWLDVVFTTRSRP